MALGKRRRAAALVLLLFFAASQEQLSITKPANAVLVARPIMRSNAPALGGAAGRLRGSSVPISAEFLAGRSCRGVRRSGGKAGRGKPTSSIRMVFDQFDPRGRSKLIGRTYASDPALFEDVALLDKHSSWTDPVIFSDQTALTPTAGGALRSSVIRSLLVTAGFFVFPVLIDDLSPLLFVRDGALTDEMRLSLTGSFLPGVSLLFGALFSYTISLLVNRQIKIEEVVNAEVAALSVLVLHLEDYFRYSRSNLEASMEAAWRHTDTLIFQSRYQEILLLVQDDPLEDLMRLIIAVDDTILDTNQHRSKAGVHRDSLGYLRGVSSDLIKLRTTRLSSEGRVLPPVHFGILIILASMLLFGFTLASAQPPTPEGPVKAAFESRVLFTLLLFSFSVLLEFALDLTNPFVGRYKVRRTTTTAVMIKIRSEIVAVMGKKHMMKFDKAFGLQKRRALRDFQRNTGMELPLDK